MTQNHGRQSYFKKLFGSMVLVFLVPALLTAALFVIVQTNTVKQQMLDAYNENIAHLSYLVDSQLAAGEQLALYLTNEPYFREMSRREYNVLDFNDIQKELLRYTVNSSFVDDILLYMEGKPMSYGASGIYPNRVSPTGVTVDGKYLHEYVVDKKTFYHYRTAWVTRAGIARKALLYTAESALQPGLVFTVELDIHSLESIFKTGLSGGGQDGFSIMFNGDQSVLITSLNDDHYDPAALIEAASQVSGAKSGGTLKFDGRNYLISRVTSSSSGMTYGNLIPYGSVLSRVAVSSAVTILVVLLAFGASLVVINRIARRNYKPVEKLYTSVRDAEEPASEDTDELAAINHAFTKLKNVITQYDSNISSHMPGMRMRMLSRLINGSYDTLEDFNFDAAFVHMSFSMRCFFVALISCPEKDPDVNIVSTVENLLPKNLQGYGAATLDPGEYVFVFAADNHTYGQEMLYELFGKAGKALGDQTTMAVSQPCEDVSLIGQAYIQCRSVQSGASGQGRLTFFVKGEDAQQLLSVTDDLQEEFGRLRSAIYDGRTQDVSVILNRFVGYMENKRLSLFTTRCVCYELINTVMRAVNDLMNRDESVKVQFPKTTGLSGFHTPQELISAIYELSVLVTRELSQEHRQPGTPKVQIDEVLAYIQEHYTDYNFSVKQLAEHEGMSLSVFSQFFKAKSGMTVIDYILKCRINRAKELLKDTDMLIADIVFAIGYVSVPSFVNKFKKVTGMTPGEYRQQIKEQ